MTEYEIKIDIGRLLHYSDVLRPQIDTETLLMIIKSFSVYIRDLYKLSLEEQIFSNRYKGEWEPREESGYLEYIGTIPSTHIFDIMSDALEIREIKDNIVIRFDPGYLYPGSKLPLVKVLKAIDNGTSDFNARPIMKKTIRKITYHLPSLWTGYLKRKGVA